MPTTATAPTDVFPEGFVGLVAFLLIIAPGAAFEFVLSTARPRRDESTFHEVNRVALVGVTASLLAATLIAVGHVLWGWLDPVIGSIVEGGDVWRAHLAPITATSVGWFVTAIILATVSAVMVASRIPGRIYEEPIWRLVFRRNVPAGSRTHVVTTSTDGTRHYGFLVAYTTEDTPRADRELVLRQPLFVQRPGGGARRMRDTHRLVLSAADLTGIAVTYLKDRTVRS